MKKKSIISIACIAICVLISSVISCSKTSKNDNGTEQINSKTTDGFIKLNNVPTEVNELLQLQNTIAKRVLGKGVTKSLLENAIKTHDYAQIKKQAGMSDQEYNQYSDKLVSLKKQILIKYPQVYDVMKIRKECKSCDIVKSSLFLTSLVGDNSSAKDLISYDSFLDKTNSQEASLAAGAECQWVQYTACLLICTSTGPILY